MTRKISLREMLTEAFAAHGESWSDVEAIETPFAGALDVRFEIDHSGPHGPAPVYVWTAARVYATDSYDGADGLASLPRNPSRGPELRRLYTTPTLSSAIENPARAGALLGLLRELIGVFRADRRLDPRASDVYARCLRELERAIDRFGSRACDQRIDGAARSAAEDVVRLAMELREMLIQTMQAQDVGVRSPEEIARALTPAQQNALRTALGRTVTVDDGHATRTLTALAEKGLVEDIAGARPAYRITDPGRRAARALV